MTAVSCGASEPLSDAQTLSAWLRSANGVQGVSSEGIGRQNGLLVPGPPSLAALGVLLADGSALQRLGPPRRAGELGRADACAAARPVVLAPLKPALTGRSGGIIRASARFSDLALQLEQRVSRVRYNLGTPPWPVASGRT